MAELTKETIMLTSNRLFSQDGVREVSIDDICRKLCISKKTFYQFYSTKEDLVGDVVTYNVERRKAEFEKLVEGKTTLQVLKALFSLVSRKKTLDSDKRMAKDIMKYYPETFIRRSEERVKAMNSFITDCLSEGMAEGVVRSYMNMDASLFLVFAMHEGMAQYLDGTLSLKVAKMPFKSLSAAFEDIVIRSLLTRRGLEEYKSLDNDKNS